MLDWTIPNATRRGYVDLLHGYQYWQEHYVASAEGVDVAFTTVGAFRQRLTEASTERYGPFIGIRWRF